MKMFKEFVLVVGFFEVYLYFICDRFSFLVVVRFCDVFFNGEFVLIIRGMYI